MSTPQPLQHSAFTGIIGVARADITPPVEIYSRNWGAAKHDVANGIHRPLPTTVLTFQPSHKSAPLVLVALDLGWWRSAQNEDFLRGGLLEALELDEARVMMNLSHTHAGPSMSHADSDQPGGELIAPYLEHVRDTVISATQQALKSAVPATLAWQYGKCDLATNRDLPDTEKPRFVCGFNPAENADDTLLVGRVTNEDGILLATLANYACHPTTLAWDNKLISPDYIGAMREVVEQETGAPCAFLQGASGELAPHHQYVGDADVADRHGRQLGYAVLSTLHGMLPPGTRLEYSGVVESGAPLAVWKPKPTTASNICEAIQLEVELPLKDWPTFDELQTQLANCEDRVLQERLRRKSRVREAVGDGKTTRIPLWVWQLGDTILVGQSGEAYSWLQTELRRKFPQRAVAVMNLVNGSIGYLPRAELYDEDLYAVWQTPFERGSLEEVYAACEGAIEKL